MKRLLVYISLIAILLGLVLSGISDAVISVADTTIGNSSQSSSVSVGDNSGSASATVTITMFTVTDD